MRRQRLTAILLAATMFIMTGCSSATSGVGKTEDQSVSAPVAGDVSGEAVEDESEEGLEQGELMAAPELTFTAETIDRYSDDGEVWLLHVEYDEVTVFGEGYEALAEGVGAWNEARLDDILADTEYYAEEAASYVEMSVEGNYRDYNYFDYTRTLQPKRVDSKVVSLLEYMADYAGGAHGNYGYKSVTFDAQTGAQLTLQDIVKDMGSFRKEATAYMIDKVYEDYGEGLFPDYADTLEEMWQYDQAWYLDAAGLTFVFEPYYLGPYAMGSVEVTLPLNDFVQYLEEDYVIPGAGGYVQLPLNEDIPLILPLSSHMENILQIKSSYNDHFGMAEVSVKLNDSETEMEMFGWLMNAYLVNTGMYSYIIMDADYASDDYVTIVYDVSTGVVRETDRLGGVCIVTERMYGDRMELSTRLDVLGTYRGVKTYTIDTKSGKLQTEDEFYQIDRTGVSPGMLTRLDMSVFINGEQTNLPEGSRISVTGTDDEGIALFLNVDTGEEGEIHYVRGDGAEDDWTIHINGIPEQDYFEEYLPYAG
ncbi:MAG: DUF3298 domain-containing protein [Lachnospiraceae bacterium]|nr:DUF3298 domain-containing protein [Lachnospiraceae bacterium]